jgi:ribonucleoside-diphosphate reductase alpha chain
MHIKKRDGRLEQLSFDKVIYRLKKLCNDRSLGVLETIDPDVVAQRVVSSIYDGVTSSELDEQSARISISMTENIEYQKLASRITISNAHKNTNGCFSEVMERLYNNTDRLDVHAPIIADDVIQIVRRHKDTLNSTIDYSRDYLFDYFGYKTLERSYLQKILNKQTGKMEVVERPQHLYMRVAVGIHKDNIDAILKTYHLISQHYYTHATPTMYNAGTRSSNFASCFHEDTIVTTVNRGPIKIRDIKIGDTVVTHMGNVKPVVQLHKNLLNNRKLYEIQVAKSQTVKVTNNHKLWALKVSKNLKTEKKDKQTYDLEFVKDYLEKDNCKLLSTEYKSMKEKLQFICMCGKISNTSFENIYRNNIRCNDRSCIYSRERKSLSKSKKISDPQWISVEDLQIGDYIGIPNKIQSVDYSSTMDILQFKNLLENQKNRKATYSLNLYETDTEDKDSGIDIYDKNEKVVLKTYSEHSAWKNVKKSVKIYRDHSPINRFWTIDSEFSKFIGIFYGDGHILTCKDTFGNKVCRGIGITIHNANKNLIEYCQKVGEQLFGIKATIHKMKNQNVTQVIYSSVLVGEIFKHLFGIHFNGKKIWNEMFKWDKNMIVSLLEGLITTDGCITKGHLVSLQMSNCKFMRDLYYLLRNNNIDTSYGSERMQKGATQKHVQINIPIKDLHITNVNKYYEDDRLTTIIKKNCRNQYSSIEIDGFKFLKLENKTEIIEDIPEYVYTLGIQDDHSYNVEGLVAQNCFLIGTEDSIEGIFKTITDCGKISKMAGGIGLHITSIRAKGSMIRGTNGPSDGIIPMIKVYNETAKYINQGSRRKGSFALYLEPWHADIIEFLDLKKNQGHEDMRARDLFYAVWMPDLFMKRVEEDGDWHLMCPDECPGLNDVYGDEFEELYNKYVSEGRHKRTIKAQEVWTKILDAQIETGTPYIGYKDAVNKKCNQKNLGTIRSSNLCVAPETMILTSKGYFPIVELENKEVEVWNGEEFSTTIVKKTGQDQELIKVVLSNGSELECTPYHKFYIVRGKRPKQYPRLIQVDAQNLKPGMKLIKSEYPVVKQGNSDFPYPYEHGLFCADGTYEHNSENSHLPRITLYNDKKSLLPYIKTRIQVCEEDKFGRINCRLPVNIKQKYIVPINYDLDIKLRWLEGLSDGDGCIIKSDNLTSIQISSIHEDFLINVKYLLQTLGCDPKIREASEAGWKFLPDGNGGQDEYYCQKLYRLLITSYDVANLVNLGFNPKRLKVSGIYPKNNTRRWITVEKIQNTNRISDTYCFKEEKRGMGIFNGVLTGQCSEISLYSDNKEYATCNLASIALPKYVKYDDNNKPYFDFEHLRRVAEYIIQPMNDVIDNNYYPVPETKTSNMKHRPLGIGVQGLVDVYVKMRFPFESPEAKRLNKEIFETIYYGCLQGSIDLAKRDGAYSSFKESPFSKGKLQFDLAAEFDGINLSDYLSGRWDWDALKGDLVQYGCRNSMLLALMPTASTAQIMNNTEAFEPFDSCIFKRRVLSGEYIVVNKYLVEDLTRLGLWTKELKDTIIANDGSIQNIDTIPDDLKDLYKTVWEISMKSVIEQCHDRGVFVDQMQSMNLFMANPNYKRLTSMHFYAWKNHLKTGMYYLRSKSSAAAGKFSIDPELEKRIMEKRSRGEELQREEKEIVLACSRENPEACNMCSS